MYFRYRFGLGNKIVTYKVYKVYKVYRGVEDLALNVFYLNWSQKI